MTAVKLLIVDELGYVPLSLGLVLSFSSKHPVSDMNAVRLSSPPTCRSRNGPVSSPPERSEFGALLDRLTPLRSTSWR